MQRDLLAGVAGDRIGQLAPQLVMTPALRASPTTWPPGAGALGHHHLEDPQTPRPDQPSAPQTTTAGGTGHYLNRSSAYEANVLASIRAYAITQLTR